MVVDIQEPPLEVYRCEVSPEEGASTVKTEALTKNRRPRINESMNFLTTLDFFVVPSAPLANMEGMHPTIRACSLYRPMQCRRSALQASQRLSTHHEHILSSTYTMDRLSIVDARATSTDMTRRLRLRMRQDDGNAIRRLRSTFSLIKTHCK